ncbi:MAG: CHAD domain-containing protein [Geminicoccaceae bacterium]|nr:CHAD domain-containing protein [Geminicoccaceae bacterium]
MDRNTRLHERITIASGSPWSLLRLLGWRELVALAAALALAVVFAVLAGVLFLLIFPVALAAGLVPPPRKAAKLELEPELAVAEAFRRIGRACLGHWLANEVPAADGRDVEGVHQLRVALRRLRSAFSIFRSVLPEADRERFVGELRWLLGELGPARDRDVLAHDLLPPLRGSGVLEGELAALDDALGRGRPALYERVRAALSSRRYADLVLDLAIWLELERFVDGASAEARAVLEGPVLPFARDALERRWRKAKKRCRRFEKLTAEERHALRIAIKKLRYGLDFFAGLWPGSAARKFARHLAELQDRLGHLNDVVVAEGLARAVAAETRGEPAGGAVALAAGAVIGWYARATERMLREAAERWEAFAEQEPFWRETA